MSRLEGAFGRARSESRPALIAYVCAGDPSLAVTEELALSLAAAGADVLELGVPFSDPVADGPVIEAASHRAIANGTTLEKILTMVERVRERGGTIPLVLMTYLNPVLSLGIEAFVARAAAAGIDGVIVPDAPLEESSELSAKLAARGVDLVLLAAPTTSPERLARIGAATRGFLYFVSVTGVTGARRDLPEALPAQLDAARRASKTPVAVGFGVSAPDQVRALRAHTDGIVVGSAIVQALVDAEGDPTAVVQLVETLAGALR